MGSDNPHTQEFGRLLRHINQPIMDCLSLEEAASSLEAQLFISREFDGNKEIYLESRFGFEVRIDERNDQITHQIIYKARPYNPRKDKEDD